MAEARPNAKTAELTELELAALRRVRENLDQLAQEFRRQQEALQQQMFGILRVAFERLGVTGPVQVENVDLETGKVTYVEV